MSKKHFQTINRIWEQKKIGLRLHAEGNPEEGVFLVRLEDSGEKRFDFIRRAIRYSLEYSLKRKGRKILLKESRETLSEDSGFQALSSFQLYFNPSLEEECEEEDFLPEISSDTEMQGRGESAPSGNAEALFYKAVEELEQLLLHLDWSAEKIEVYRLWQSRTHKPQDKIEIKGECFSCNALVNISSYGRGSEKVRLRLPKEDFALGFTSSYAGDGAGGIGEMIFLTNRLIEQLFGEKWDKERLGYAPVIVYEYAREDYAIGLPLADKLDGIFLSSLLAESKKDEAKSYDYMVFNRYTDSRLHLDFTKADYGDKGRVKERKVMLPRYYKRLLGYLDFPLKMIREEEFLSLREKLHPKEREAFDACYQAIPGELFYRIRDSYEGEQFEVSNFVEDLLHPGKKDSSIIRRIIHAILQKAPDEKEAYPKLFGGHSIEEEFDPYLQKGSKEEESFFGLKMKKSLIPRITEKTPDMEGKLKKIRLPLEEILEFALRQGIAFPERKAEEETHEILKNKIYAGFAEGRLDVFDRVDLLKTLRCPDAEKEERKSLKTSAGARFNSLLNFAIGKADYLLKAEWSSETDDRNNVARLNSNMMNLLGVSENDKIVIHFGKKQAVLRVLDKDTLSDYQIGIPAPTRKSLGMNSINDIVTVHRDMMHIFLRHSEEQTIAFLGTILAVFQVISNLWLGTLLCIILVPAILYLVLNEERIKVK